MPKKNLYDDEVFEEILERIRNLSPESSPDWGSMEVGQMLAHCAEVQDVANGKELRGTPFLFKLLGPLIKPLVTSEKPFKKGAQTHPQYVMTDPEDFETQRNRLIDSVRTMRALGRRDYRHPVFGGMTAEESGWVCYKHLDHHLRQFGV